MSDQAIKTAGVIAGIVVVLGVLAIGAQYWSSMSGGASARITDLTQLPNSLLVSKEDYVTMQSLLDRYMSVSDLATKNQIVKEFRVIFDNLSQ